MKYDFNELELKKEIDQKIDSIRLLIKETDEEIDLLKKENLEIKNLIEENSLRYDNEYSLKINEIKDLIKRKESKIIFSLSVFSSLIFGLIVGSMIP